MRENIPKIFYNLCLDNSQPSFYIKEANETSNSIETELWRMESINITKLMCLYWERNFINRNYFQRIKEITFDFTCNIFLLLAIQNAALQVLEKQVQVIQRGFKKILAAKQLH